MHTLLELLLYIGQNRGEAKALLGLTLGEYSRRAAIITYSTDCAVSLAAS